MSNTEKLYGTSCFISCQLRINLRVSVINHVQGSDPPNHLCCFRTGLVLITECGPTHGRFISSSLYLFSFEYFVDNREKFWVIVLKWSVVIKGLYIQVEVLNGVISSPARRIANVRPKYDIHLKLIHSVRITSSYRV
jgi:hypothetical protein